MTIDVDGTARVSALWSRPGGSTACLVLAHGAGAGMTHCFMEALAEGLHARRVATLRFQFPAMEAGSKRPDRPALAQATVRAAVGVALELAPDLPIFAGGKSFGGRMTSQAQAADAMPGVLGLAFFGFPLHPSKQPSTARAEHLATVRVPMLFIQGTRDTLGEIDLVREVVGRLVPRATLWIAEGADHGFHAQKRSGRTDEEVLAALLDRTAAWLGEVLSAA